ncbi:MULTISPECIES: BC_2427 family protein [unclassified Lysinibacillus]|uniref:BC_2427 family protein n=1 Tax=unclassified Lysinibacillus TaxID=2636778 RepID=UPI0037FB8A7B
MQTPWINYKVMKEISSEQKYNCQIEPIEMDQASQQNSPYSDFINDFLDVEKESEFSLASHVDSNCELLTPFETNVGDEMDNPLDTDDVEETKPVEEQNDVSPLDFNREKLIPFETNVGGEMNNPLDTEEADETMPVEERDFVAQLDSNYELSIPFETNVGGEMNDPLDSEDTDETKPMEEQNFVACLDSVIPPETNIEDKMNDPLNIEDAEETKPLEEQDFASPLDFDCELPNPSETNVGDKMNDSLDSDDAEETKPVEEQDFTNRIDFKRETCSPSESDAGKKNIDSEEMENNNFTDRVHAFPGSVQGEVYSKTKKSPFSTHVEIDDFLHAPICGEAVKNTFDFLDPNNHLTPQFETKLFSTTTNYPEQPDCRLVHSKINQITFLMKTDTYDKNNQESNPSKSVVVPLHNTPSTKKGEIDYHTYSSGDFMHIRAPVVVGEYKIEICLEEKILFEKGIEGVKDILNEVVLTNCRFVPNQFSQSLGNGTCSALRGNLFIEGYIHQSIEYTASRIGKAVPAQNDSLIHSNQMCQNIVLEIIIHLLQAQKIRVPKI